MTRTLPLLLAGVLALAAAPAAAQDRAAAPDEYAVWSALLDREFSGQGVTRLVVHDSTQPPRHRSVPDARAAVERARAVAPPQRWVLTPALREALDDFVLANARRWPLEKRFGTRLPVQWLRTESGPQRPEVEIGQMDPDLQDAGLTGSSGMIRLSRVGFDRARRVAVTFVDHWCGPLCAEGKFVVFERQPDGSWKLVNRYALWAS